MGSRLQPVYRDWEKRHKPELPTNWFDDDKNRVGRIREYGKFKLDYDAKVSVMREKSPTEREFLRDHADRYPSLKPVLTEKPEPVPTQTRKVRQYEPSVREKAPKDQPKERPDKSSKPGTQREQDQMKNPPPQQEPSPQTAPTRKDKPKPTPKKEPAKREPDKSKPRRD
jgi:hypothetical protein